MYVKTRNSIVTDQDISDDISGLYRTETVRTILGNNLRFIIPSVVQIGLLNKFLVTSLQDLVTTPQERASMSYEAVFSKCLEKLVSVSDKDVKELSQEQQMIIGFMFSNPEANKYFFEVIKQTFPDINNPEHLTPESLLSIFNELVSIIFG